MCLPYRFFFTSILLLRIVLRGFNLVAIDLIKLPSIKILSPSGTSLLYERIIWFHTNALRRYGRPSGTFFLYLYYSATIRIVPMGLNLFSLIDYALLNSVASEVNIACSPVGTIVW